MPSPRLPSKFDKQMEQSETWGHRLVTLPSPPFLCPLVTVFSLLVMPTRRILGTIYEDSQREVKSPLPCRSVIFCSAPSSLYTHKHTQTHTLSYIYSCINSYSCTHTHPYTHMCVHEALLQAKPQDGIRTHRFLSGKRHPSWEPGTGHFVALSERTIAVRKRGIEYPGTHMHVSPLTWLLCLEVS